jgi:hypothetical protein
MTLETIEISAEGTRIALGPSQGELLLNPEGEAFWRKSDEARLLPGPNAYDISRCGLALISGFDCHAYLQDILDVAEQTGFPFEVLHPIASPGVGLRWDAEREGALYLTLEGEPVATFSLCERCKEEIKRRARNLLKELPDRLV